MVFTAVITDCTVTHACLRDMIFFQTICKELAAGSSQVVYICGLITVMLTRSEWLPLLSNEYPSLLMVTQIRVLVVVCRLVVTSVLSRFCLWSNAYL